MVKKSTCGLLGVFGLLFFLGTGAFAVPPNILMILVDDLGYGDLSSYGAEDMETPNIDGLMSAGMKFSAMYANCPVCSPTRAALLTGKTPDKVGVPGVIRTHPEDSWGYFAQEAVTLPSLLKKAGYTTAIIGKWHLGLEPENHPLERGFDFFHGFLGDMMDDYWNHRRFNINYMQRNKEEIDPPGHATDLFSSWAEDYLQQQAENDAPFFLYLAYNAPHTPIHPPPEWVKKVQKREAGITEKRAKLVALIEHLDEGIGRVVNTLKSTGQAQNTLLVFTSDNGGLLAVGANNGALRAGKQDMYEGGIRVPGCAVWPGKIQAGSATDALAMTMDLYPTFCEAAGLSVEHAIDGVSLLPLMTGQDPGLASAGERTLVWVRREGNRRYQGQDYYALRKGDWKLLHNNPFSPLELYNLKEDPREEQNLADKNQQKFNELAKALRAHLQEAGSIPWQKAP